jgi:hypothetical protein
MKLHEKVEAKRFSLLLEKKIKWYYNIINK